MPASVMTADLALARLVAGNRRFRRGEARFPTIQKDVLAALAKGQQPYATIIGCSDSRVPPELIFDAGFGELFIVRIAGNVISAEIMGTLQYAAVHLHTQLFVVLGHDGCGAVQAALSMQYSGPKERVRIQRLLRRILPGLPKPAADQTPATARHGRRSQRAVVHAAAAGDAGRPGPTAGRRDQARGCHL